MDRKVVLAVNAGSSSIKVSLYTVEQARQDPVVIVHAQISDVTGPSPSLDYVRGSYKVKSEKIKGINSHEDAFHHVLERLETDTDLSEVSRKEDITDIVHRVVHGGDYPGHRVISSKTYHHIEELSNLAPLHNASALAIIKLCLEVLPNATNSAHFDTSFHHTLPKHVRTYLVDPEVAENNRLRKYGFHGISYAFITRSVAAFLGKKESELNIIALHLGSGASACAIQGGKSIDTTMGLTPLDGLPGATRSGSVDPSLAFHFSPKGNKEMHISDVRSPNGSTRACMTDDSIGGVDSEQEKWLEGGR